MGRKCYIARCHFCCSMAKLHTCSALAFWTSWKERTITIGAPCAVRIRSLICALTSGSPATCAAAAIGCVWHLVQPELGSLRRLLNGAHGSVAMRHLGVVDEALARPYIWRQLSRAGLFQTLDDGLQRSALPC